MYDAIVVGGGFYGAAVAIYLRSRRGFSKVVLVEREEGLLARASYGNQARVHNGYHYPRSFTTAFRSRVNFPRFVRDYPNVIRRDFVNLYAIARRNSKISARQFERFCGEIDARLIPAPHDLVRLFDRRTIEKVFLVEEYALDGLRLRRWAQEQLNYHGVELRLGARVRRVTALPGGISVGYEGRNGDVERLSGRFLFNCAYSGLGQFTGDFQGASASLKHEIMELALMEAPPVLDGLGITVMDGPFFSFTPFPARGVHSLSHVRYSPLVSWTDRQGFDPYRKLDDYRHVSRVGRMVRDVARYVPAIGRARYVESMVEVKTVLTKNETDDGRPILFERSPKLPNCYSILGGKIDNIYDLLERLDAEPLQLVG